MTQKNLLQAAGDGTTVPAGSIGEVLEDRTSASVGTSYVDRNTLTLTTGIWLVTGCGMISGAAGATGVGIKLNVKGAASYLNPTTEALQYMPTAQYCTATLPPKFVSVAPGDANKTVVLQAVAIGATSTVSTSLSAVRIA